MKRKRVDSRTDAVTRDMQAEETTIEREFRFPSLGVTVKANSYQEALKKAHKIVKK